MSTPYGTRDFFYEAWMHGGETWERVKVPAEECGRIPASFLEEERRTMTQRIYRREYGCEFVNAEGVVFDRDLVEASFSSDFEPLVICKKTQPK
jgi:hypothetical protein